MPQRVEGVACEETVMNNVGERRDDEVMKEISELEHHPLHNETYDHR
jgi:hypothetical protein